VAAGDGSAFVSVVFADGSHASASRLFAHPPLARSVKDWAQHRATDDAAGRRDRMVAMVV
jgi:hypothetical protein